MSSKPPRKRRSVEIYFILYLAALILLIPQKDDKKGNKGDKGIESDYGFTLVADKPILNCIFNSDSLGITALSMDTTNKIFYTGEIYDVNFTFEIIDQNFRQKIVVKKNDRSSKFFRFEELPHEKCAIFHWQPPLKDLSDVSYLVNVVATGKKLIDSKNERIVSAKTQFTLSIHFNNGMPQFTRIDTIQTQLPPESDFQGNNPNFGNAPLPGNFFIKPRDNMVIRYSRDKFQNVIYIYGLNKKSDLKEAPLLTVEYQNQNQDCGGSAKIQNINADNIEIVGVVPSCGNIKVTLKLTRVDGSIASTHFDVKTLLYGEPDYPKTAFPGVKYKIDPKLPISTGQEMKTRIVSKDGRTVYASSMNGDVIYFTPSINDTGKTLFLESFADTNLIQQAFQINVRNFPPPEIVDIKQNTGGCIRLSTQSYGLSNNSENMVVSIEFLDESNANYQTIAGKYHYNSEKLIYYQEFDICPKNRSKPLQFKLKLVSANGQKSPVFSYPNQR